MHFDTRSRFQQFCIGDSKSVVDPGFFNRGFKISEGVRFDQATILTQSVSKQCRPRSDATEPTLRFATHIAIVDIFTGSNIQD